MVACPTWRFSRNGDAGTTVALEDARTEIVSGEEQRLIDMINNAPPGPIETRWGLGFRGYRRTGRRRLSCNEGRIEHFSTGIRRKSKQWSAYQIRQTV
jgi:hypothetical protein